MQPTVYEEFSASDAVFVGKAVSSRDITTLQDKKDSILFSGTQRIYKFEISQIYKGQKTKSVEINAGDINTNCTMGFVIGETYLIYADKSKQRGILKAFRMCGLIEEIENARDQISIIGDILKNKSEPQIYGSLKFTDENEKETFLTNTKVLLKDRERILESVTDENGVFRFYDVPAGKYFIEPVLPSTRKVNFADTEAVVITDNGRIYTDIFADDIEELAEDYEDSKDEIKESELPKSVFTEFRLSPNFEVSGQVFDANGKPINCKKIYLVRLETLSKLDVKTSIPQYIMWQISADFLSAWKWCRDDGSFTVSADKSGKYLLAVELEKEIDAAKLYFHSQTADYKNAEVINFEKPEQLKINIKLPVAVSK